MNSDEIARIRQVCKEIADDMERDAKEFDGKPFNGRTVRIIRQRLIAECQ